MMTRRTFLKGSFLAASGIAVVAVALPEHEEELVRGIHIHQDYPDDHVLTMKTGGQIWSVADAEGFLHHA